jgi:hypothetical protein
MPVKTLIPMFATVAASLAAPTIVHAAQEKPSMQTPTPKPTKSGHAAVNGVNYYYAVYGAGEPLLLLHGAILPNITHYEMGLAPQLADTALPFLDGQGRAKSWDEQVSRSR